MDEAATRDVYRFFTEIGILNQLSRAQVERHLPGTLSATHFGILGHLSRRPGGETPMQLTHAFQVPKTTMTHMLKVLVAGGWIEIAPNPDDGRSKVARITGAGQALIARVMGAMAPEMASALDADALARIARLLPDLAALRDLLDRARDGNGDGRGD